MVFVSRFLASLEMTAKQKKRKKRLAAAKPSLNASFSHTKRSHFDRREKSVKTITG